MRLRQCLEGRVPEIVFEEKPEWVDLSHFAWNLAYEHVKDISGMPQTPYMDEGFCETEIWIWDTCFMALFSKYAQDIFPGVESLDNFYKVIHGDARLPMIIPMEEPPSWSGWTKGKPAQLQVHIADNPPLFAWGEYENAMISGHRKRIEEILLKKRYLQKHYDLWESAKAGTKIPYVRLPFCLEKDSSSLGFRWEGGRSGMDNTPRGRLQPRQNDERPSRPTLLWLDALAQQSSAALFIGKCAKLLGKMELSEEFFQKNRELNDILNRHYWSEEDSFYFDIDSADLSFCKVRTIATFWTIFCGAATGERLEKLCKTLSDPNDFGGEIPLVSLSRTDADFSPAGHYWRGGVWLPTAYMTLKALDAQGKYELSTALARKILEQMSRCFRDYSPHSIWEAYSPSKAAPSLNPRGDLVREDFCGWSALGPISMFIEDIVGIRAIDAFAKRIEWIPPKTISGKVGILNLKFGGLTTSMIMENDECDVESDGNYTLSIAGDEHSIKAGRQRFKL